MGEFDRLARHHADQARATTESASVPPLSKPPTPSRRPLVIALAAFGLTLLVLAPLAWRQQQGSLSTTTAGPVTTTRAQTSTTQPPTASTSTTQAAPSVQAVGTSPPFVPPSVDEGDRVAFPVTFLDGSRLEVLLPHIVADKIRSFTPAASVGWDDLHARSLDVLHGTITELFGDATPLATYVDAAGNPVPYYSVAGSSTDYLAFQFGSWVVLAWDAGPNASENFTDEDRARFAALLGGYETEDGFLVLDPVAPMTVGRADIPDGQFEQGIGQGVYVGILKGEAAQVQCSPDAPATSRGYGITVYEPGRIGVCAPDRSVLLHISGASLSEEDLGQIEVRSMSGSSAEHACANDTSGRVDPLEPNGVLAIYFSCRADPLLTFYVPTTGRTIGEISGDVASQLNEVITLYAEGPTAEEQLQGYGAFAGVQLPINSVSLVGSRAIIDFGGDITDINGLGTGSFDGVVLSELQANVFQFPGIEELELQIDGDCARFGTMMEYGRCIVLTRAEWDAQSTP